MEDQGIRFERLLEALNSNQSELARKIGVSPSLLPMPERVGKNTLSWRFRQAVRTLHRSGALPDIRGIEFYSLKDTLAIYLLDNGVDVESAMRHFRHHDLSIFQRYVKRLGVVNENGLTLS